MVQSNLILSPNRYLRRSTGNLAKMKYGCSVVSTGTGVVVIIGNSVIGISVS